MLFVLEGTLLIALLLGLFSVINTEDNRYAVFLMGLILKIRTEKDFESLVIYQTTNGKNCIEDDLLKNSEIPVGLIGTESDCHLQNNTFNHKVLLMYCLGNDFLISETEAFLSCLGRLRYSRIIFLWTTNEPENSVDANSKLFEFCKESFLPNAISIYTDFWRTNHFYRYEQHPTFSIVKHQLEERIFPEHLGNLQGTALRTLPDQASPRCIVYFDKNVMHVTGYIARIVKEFAKKHNATLVYPYPLDSETLYNYFFVQDVIKNNSLDVPMSASSPVRLNNPEYFSRVVEQATWFPMIPLMESTPVNEIFLLIIASRLTGILVLLWLGFSILLTFQNRLCSNENVSFPSHLFYFLQTLLEVFRGMLSQSISLLQKPGILLKAVYLLLFISSIFLCTTYNAYFQTFLTNAPKATQINSFDDLLKSQIRIYCLEREFESFKTYVGDSFWEKYKKAFQISEKKEFFRSRQAMISGKAYTVTSSLWVVLDQIQSRMSHRRFHHPPEMYFTKGLYLSIPQYEHSIFRSALNTLILQLQESGILSYWRHNSLKDLVVAGKLTLTREWVITEPEGLSVHDFYWVWLIHLSGVIMGGLLFLLEILDRHWNGFDE